MTPWIEDRLLARSDQFGQTWTLERLHEALDARSSALAGRLAAQTLRRLEGAGRRTADPGSSPSC